MQLPIQMIEIKYKKRNQTCPVGLAKIVRHSGPISQRLFSFQIKICGGCASISLNDPHQIFNRKINKYLFSQ
jgi:hypothetical protein